MSFAENHLPLLRALAAPEAARHVAEHRLVHLPGNQPPWTDSGLRLDPGDHVTWLAEGKVFLSEELGIFAGAKFHLWARVGERGPIFSGTRDTLSFTAAEKGPLFLCVYQGEWASPDGTLATPPEAYDGCSGALETLVVRWKGEARAGLEALQGSAGADPLLDLELARLAAPPRPPRGWRHLWFLGETEIFTDAVVDGQPAIAVHTAGDVGILQKDAPFPLDEGTRVSWAWRVERLPSAVAEDTMPTHDYLSIAFEFENGLDLTYYWSAALPEGHHFTCPLPTWAARETHWVLRSGVNGLRSWSEESRGILDDYRAAIGGDPPRRIVAVWLIAVSLFRRGVGEAAFRDIRLSSGERSARVL